jgi:hypothetical protein
MLADAIKDKHVELFMSNGHDLAGFVQNVGGEYLRLIERDNSEIIIKMSDISYARLGLREAEVPKAWQSSQVIGQALPNPELVGIGVCGDPGVSDTDTYLRNQDFSIVADDRAAGETYAKQTEFVRQTPRGNK